MTTWAIIPFLIICSLYDLIYRKIPNKLILPAIVLSGCYQIFMMQWQVLLIIAVNCLIMGIIFGHGFYKGYIGAADLKVMIFVSCWLSNTHFILFIIATLLFGAINSIITLYKKLQINPDKMRLFLAAPRLEYIMNQTQLNSQASIPYAISITLGYISVQIFF